MGLTIMKKKNSHVVKFMSESGIILKVTKNNYAMLQTNVKKKNLQ
jgi:hypothetical protein